MTKEDPKLHLSPQLSLPAVLLLEAFSLPTSPPSQKAHKYGV